MLRHPTLAGFSISKSPRVCDVATGADGRCQSSGVSQQCGTIIDYIKPGNAFFYGNDTRIDVLSAFKGGHVYRIGEQPRISWRSCDDKGL